MKKRLGLALAVAVVFAGSGLIAPRPAAPSTPIIGITSAQSQKVMDVFEASTFPGARVVLFTFHGSSNQIWSIREFSKVNGYSLVLMQSHASGMVLDVMDNSKQANAVLVQDHWSASPSQLWLLYPFGATGFQVLVNVNSGLVADVAGGSTADGTSIIQWPWHGGVNQLWGVPPVQPLTA